MAQLKVIKRDGSELTLDVENGLTVMEAIRNAGVSEILALCGGCCSCATCHVHIDSERFALLPEISSNENDLLDFSTHRDAYSRLSCQLIVSDELSGMCVTLAQED